MHIADQFPLKEQQLIDYHQCQVAGVMPAQELCR
jgi:hypothetical protein